MPWAGDPFACSEYRIIGQIVDDGGEVRPHAEAPKPPPGQDRPPRWLFSVILCAIIPILVPARAGILRFSLAVWEGAGYDGAGKNRRLESWQQKPA